MINILYNIFGNTNNTIVSKKEKEKENSCSLSKEDIDSYLPSWFINEFNLTCKDYDDLRLNKKLINIELNIDEYNDFKNNDFSKFDKLEKIEKIPDEDITYILLNCQNDQIEYIFTKYIDKIDILNIKIPNDFVVNMMLDILKNKTYDELMRTKSSKVWMNPDDKIIDFLLKIKKDNIFFPDLLYLNPNDRSVDSIEYDLCILGENDKISKTLGVYQYFKNENPRMSDIFDKWLHTRAGLIADYSVIQFSLNYIGQNYNAVDYIENAMESDEPFFIMRHTTNDICKGYLIWLFTGLLTNKNEKSVVIFEKYIDILKYIRINNPDQFSHFLKNPALINNSYYQNNDFILK
jgi:hypothetical protein